MRRPTRPFRAAFSLLEMVIVLVIMGIVAAIAIPRMSRATESARAGALRGGVDQLQRSIELYAAEHADRGPELEPDGSLASAGKTVAIRLMRPTDEAGALSPAGPCGPYLRMWPCNPYNGLFSVRIDGPPAGTNAAGWRLNSLDRRIEGDHVAGAVASGRMRAVGVAEVEGLP